MLEQGGFVVITAADGPEAIRLSQEYSGRIDLVLTDVVMPLMSGHALARVLQSNNPALPILLMSGHYESAECAPFLVLPKPFSVDLLLTSVRNALGLASSQA
jgi:CheY-like chemotaxis protein